MKSTLIRQRRAHASYRIARHKWAIDATASALGLLTALGPALDQSPAVAQSPSAPAGSTPLPTVPVAPPAARSEPAETRLK